MDHEEHVPETPEEWALARGAKLHGMSAERWDAYVRFLDSEEALSAAYRKLADEAKELHAAWHDNKAVWAEEDKERRLELSRTLRERRAHRMADLQARRTELDNPTGLGA